MKRVVASITTLPSRLDGLKKVILSLLQQTVLPDCIYINVPYKTKKGLLYDEEKLRCLESMSDIIKINRCEDEGPITKLTPTLDSETDPDTIIITFDDDNYVDSDVIRLFLKKARMYPDSCLSFSGWCVGQFPFYYQLISDNKEDAEVDWLQGCHGILYHRGLINSSELRNFRKDIDILDRNDDHRISAYLTCPKISIGYPANKYFYSIGNNNLDSISGADGFTKEVMDLSWNFRKEGIYYHNYNSFDSMIFIPVFLLVIVLLTLLLTWPSRKYIFIPVLILLLVITGILIYNRCENLRMKPYLE